MKPEHKHLVQTARLAGLSYLLLAVTGVLGFIVFHPKVYNAEATKTLANLSEHEALARTRLLLEFGIVVSQALAATYFFKLFRNYNRWAAGTLATWGTVNAIMIMISAVAMASCIGVANTTMPTEQKLLAIQILQQVISHAWGVGSLFFGLWLIPMGYIVVQSRRMPLWLGRVLIIGGIGYMLSAFIGYAGFTGWTNYLTIPATVGEFWMIAYLLIFGVRTVEATVQQKVNYNIKATSYKI